MHRVHARRSLCASMHRVHARRSLCTSIYRVHARRSLCTSMHVHACLRWQNAVLLRENVVAILTLAAEPRKTHRHTKYLQLATCDCLHFASVWIVLYFALPLINYCYFKCEIRLSTEQKSPQFNLDNLSKQQIIAIDSENISKGI